MVALCADELFDQRTHRRARCVAAGFGAQAGAKEILQLKRPKGRGHVFGGGNAADGGLVQPQLVRNLAQDQRAHGHLAMGEKTFLPLDNSRADPQDGVEPLLDVFNKPARLLQALLQAGVAGAVFATTAVVAQHIGVNVVHAQPGHDLGVEHDAKLGVDAISDLARGHNQHIGHHNIALHVHKAAPWLGLQPGNQRNSLARLRVGATTALHQGFDIAAGQHIHGLGAYTQGQRQQHGNVGRGRFQRIVELGA